MKFTKVFKHLNLIESMKYMQSTFKNMYDLDKEEDLETNLKPEKPGWNLSIDLEDMVLKTVVTIFALPLAAYCAYRVYKNLSRAEKRSKS